MVNRFMRSSVDLFRGELSVLRYHEIYFRALLLPIEGPLQGSSGARFWL